MDTRKIIWGLRSIFYKMLFGKSGKLCYIGKPISIVNPKYIFIGNKVRIYPGARLECHDGGTIVIEDNVSIGQNVHITSGLEELRIKSGTTITGNVFITNMDHNYEIFGTEISKQGYKTKKTLIMNNCFLGFGVGIQAGTSLGCHCVVGAHSLVKGTFGEGCVIVGVPGRVIKKYNQKIGEWERAR